MANPFNTGMTQNTMTKESAVNLMMKQAFQMGTDNFVSRLINRNPQAMSVYKSLMQSGNPVQFYYDLMARNGMSKEQATEFARKNGIKL